MKRRSFLQALCAVLGLGVPIAASAKPLRDEFSMVHKGLNELPKLRDFPPFVMIHRDDDCDGVAYRVWRKPKAGERLVSGDFTNLDGTPVLAGSRIRCGTCGRAPWRFRTADVEPANGR